MPPDCDFGETGFKDIIDGIDPVEQLLGAYRGVLRDVADPEELVLLEAMIEGTVEALVDNMERFGHDPGGLFVGF